MENKDTGLLLDKRNINLQKFYFTEMVRLKGINVLFRAPRKNSHYDRYGELDANYEAPVTVGCIFQEHVNQWTMKKLGWVSETQEEATIISVPIDLKGLEVGSLFIVPSNLDNTQGRVFKVIEMYTESIFPYSITCRLGPVFEDESNDSLIEDFSQTNFNLIREGEDK